MITLLTGAVLCPVHGAWAQKPRTRTLTYDPQRKEWVEQLPPPMGTAAGDLYAIRVRIQRGEYKAALFAIKRFIKDYGLTDSLYPDVLLARADALIGRNDYFKAHQVIQGFFSEFGGAPQTEEALRLEFVIAEAFLGGAKRKVLGVPLVSAEDLGLRILDEISTDYPDSRMAELALKTKGDHLFRQGEHGLAQLEYDRLLRDYPQSRYHRYCLRRAADAALASYAGIEFDETPLIEAEDRYREYRAQYPDDAAREGVDLILATIRERLAEKEFSIGRYYERTGHLSSAVCYYRGVKEQWPDTIASVKATKKLMLFGASEAAAPVEPMEPASNAGGPPDGDEP